MTEKSYLEHLNSLRNVLLRSLGVIALIFFVLVFFRNEIFLVFANPLTEILPANSSMIATGGGVTLFDSIKAYFLCRYFCSNSIFTF